MTIYEAKAEAGLEGALIRLSADWEAEDSCRGYRANSPEDFTGRRFFIAEEEGQIVGYLFGLVETAENDSTVMKKGTPYFEIEELYVIPARRSRGVGRRLYVFAEEKLRAEGLPYVLLSTATKDARRILHFYLDELGLSFWSARLFKKL